MVYTNAKITERIFISAFSIAIGVVLCMLLAMPVAMISFEIAYSVEAYAIDWVDPTRWMVVLFVTVPAATGLAGWRISSNIQIGYPDEY